VKAQENVWKVTLPNSSSAASTLTAISSAATGSTARAEIITPVRSISTATG